MIPMSGLKSRRHLLTATGWIAVVMLPVVLASFIGPRILRVIAALLAYAVAIVIVMALVRRYVGTLDASHREGERRHLAETEAIMQPMATHLSDRAEIIPVLTN